LFRLLAGCSQRISLTNNNQQQFMFDIFLQVDSTVSATAAGTAVVKTESVWTLLSKGGPIMIPLGILFALAVFFY
jgi:hypothetical protein